MRGTEKNVRGFVSLLARPAVPFPQPEAPVPSPSLFQLELPCGPPGQVPASGQSAGPS